MADEPMAQWVTLYKYWKIIIIVGIIIIIIIIIIVVVVVVVITHLSVAPIRSRKIECSWGNDVSWKGVVAFIFATSKGSSSHASLISGQCTHFCRVNYV